MSDRTEERTLSLEEVSNLDLRTRRWIRRDFRTFLMASRQRKLRKVLRLIELVILAGCIIYLVRQL